MSININVTLPLDAVAAMQTLPDETSGEQAKAVLTPATAQAMVAAVKTLPFSVAAKSVVDEKKAEHVEDRISIWIKGTASHPVRISINPDATVYDLKNTIRTQYGIWCEEQRLWFNGELLDDVKTLQAYNIGTGSQINHVFIFGN